MPWSRVALLIALPLATACQAADPAGTAPPAFLRAEITGSVEVTYSGTGDFSSGGSRALGRPATFTISSHGQGASDRQSFLLWRQREGRPGPGTYELSMPDYSQEEWSDFAAVYSRTDGGMMEAFVARSGTVRVTGSTPDRIEGTFRLSGVRYCARSVRGTPYMEGSCRPTEVDAAAPTIEVTGSFVAAHFRAEAVPLPGR